MKCRPKGAFLEGAPKTQKQARPAGALVSGIQRRVLAYGFGQAQRRFFAREIN
ncbi:MAG: hypothetical protein ACYCVM_07850 [Acidiferrobacter sp.]